jgi:hypothetical protein
MEYASSIRARVCRFRSRDRSLVVSRDKSSSPIDNSKTSRPAVTNFHLVQQITNKIKTLFHHDPNKTFHGIERLKHPRNPLVTGYILTKAKSINTNFVELLIWLLGRSPTIRVIN